jgi:hypothetical protein
MHRITTSNKGNIGAEAGVNRGLVEKEPRDASTLSGCIPFFREQLAIGSDGISHRGIFQTNPKRHAPMRHDKKKVLDGRV